MGDLMDYFTADLHFNHKNIIKYCFRTPGRTNRQFEDVTEMNEHMIEQWNKTVNETDTVYLLGDVAFGNKDEAITLCNRLKGNKILIVGNHDLFAKGDYWTRAGFSEVHKLGYGQLLPYKEFYLSHYPYRDSLMEYDLRDHLHGHAAERKKVTLLHGHVHTQWKVQDNQINVGVDVWDYTPVSLEVIRDIVANTK